MKGLNESKYVCTKAKSKMLSIIHLTPINSHGIFFPLSYFSQKMIWKWGALNQIYEYPCGPKKNISLNLAILYFPSKMPKKWVVLISKLH
jgi:hypothetical protein